MKDIKFIILIVCIFLHLFGVIRFTTGCFPWQACKPNVYVLERDIEDDK